MNFLFRSFPVFLSYFNSPRNFRSEHADEMAKLAAIESENSNGDIPPDIPLLKTPSTKRAALSPGVAKSGVAPPPSRKGFVLAHFNSRFCFAFQSG